MIVLFSTVAYTNSVEDCRTTVRGTVALSPAIALFSYGMTASIERSPERTPAGRRIDVVTVPSAAVTTHLSSVPLMRSSTGAETRIRNKTVRVELS